MKNKMNKSHDVFFTFYFGLACEPFSILFERKKEKKKYCGIYVQMPNPPTPPNPYYISTKGGVLH